MPFRPISGGGGVYSINVSGGRTSAYLLYRILERYGGELPPNAIAVFANTGREYPETLDFLKEIEQRWPGAKIHWLEYRYKKGGKPAHGYVEVDYDTASRNGEPFDAAIRARNSLPGVFRRFCTSALKVVPIELFSRKHFGVKKDTVCRVIGIRGDEPKRLNHSLLQECRVIYPLAAASVTRRDIIDFWRRSPFRLSLPQRKSNCDMCFLKRIRDLVANHQDDPHRGKWWADWERELDWSFFPKRNGVFPVSQVAMNDLAGKTGRQGSFDFPEDEGPVLDCFCGEE